MNKKNIADLYPLSPMQQGMLFHSLAAPESGVYVEQLSCVLRGDLDIAAFTKAWQMIVDRNPVLRTGFVGEGLKEPIQVVHRQVAISFIEEDWRTLSSTEQAKRLQICKQEERRRGFDLSKPPLMRLALLRLTSSSWQFIWTYHHILLDGWSLPMLLQEMFAIYGSLQQGLDIELPVRRPYRDYIAWLKRQDMAKAKAFWRENLQDFTTPTPLVVDKPAVTNVGQDVQFDEMEIQLSRQATALLQALARQNQLTLNTFVQGAWSLLLSRYSGEESVLFGATMSGRPADLADSEFMVGLFINTLPVRVKVQPALTVLDWLKIVQAQLVELRQYEFSPLVEIQGWSNVPRDLPLFESILVYENYPIDSSQQGLGNELLLENIESIEQTNYPLTLVAGADEEILLRILFDCHRFPSETIHRMLGHLVTILENMASNPDWPLASIPLLTESERHQLLVEWNETKAAYSQDKLTHQYVETWAEQTPDQVAIADSSRNVTYRELNQFANKLAHHLRQRGVDKGSLVGICLERSPDMIIGALGILKAGAAYVPMDPTYPPTRLAFMMDDLARANADKRPFVLTQEKLLSSLPTGHSNIICLDRDWPSINPESDTNLSNYLLPSDLAYVIYTSGSTGQPKGVQIEHRGLLNLIFWHQRTFKVSPADKATQIAGPGFDASVWEIWPYLTAGAAVHIPDDDVRASPNLLRDWLLQKEITVTFLPTPLAESLLTLAWPQKAAIRIMLTGGDRLHTYPTSDLPFILVNNYGPTEDTVVTTSGQVQADGFPESAPAIGRPIDNTHLYILDPHMMPVPIGVPGELHVGGDGLARGYLNRPDLTEKQFVPNPFVKTREEETDSSLSHISVAPLLYKTGDLCRYLPDGHVEFLDRIDHQVKIRGYRVELGEIEATLSQHDAVETAVVLTREDDSGNKQLVAYITLLTGKTADISNLRIFLLERLPAYMVPTIFMVLDALPLTPNGKVDRRALPAPDNARPDTGRELVPPRDTIEFKLVQIWEEVLDIRPIGVRDNFFELGGHSLSAVRVMAQIQQQFGNTLTLTHLFQGGTVEYLASLLRREGDLDLASSLVGLQTGGSKRPIYFVHPSGGSVHWYADLSRHLGNEQPFYGIQAQGLFNDQPLHTSIKAMAAHYAQAIRTFQPEGPYLIGSWSLGVIIAFELAQQLQAQGQEIALLALLDQGPELPSSEPEDDAAYLIEVFGKHLTLSLESLRQLDPDEQVAHVFSKARKVNWITPDVSLPQFRHFIRILRTHTDAWRTYRPKSYPGKITLFRAETQTDNELPLDMGWQALAKGGVEIIDVPGDHISMLQEPMIQTLASKLQDCLEKIDVSLAGQLA